MILTAYTPFAGIILCRLLMAILAVGKPIFLPIWYPEMTYPCSAYGWFNNRAASDTFPSLINLRITEELTFICFSPGIYIFACRTSIPNIFPYFA